MKKAILKITGLVAMAALMLYNVQLFDNEESSTVSLAALGNVAFAQNEGGSPNCGPLYGNSSGSAFCCGNTNSAHCYASPC